MSKQWVFIMGRRQDSNAASTPAEMSGISVQDRDCSRSLGGGAKKQSGNGEELRQVL